MSSCSIEGGEGGPVGRSRGRDQGGREVCEGSKGHAHRSADISMQRDDRRTGGGRRRRRENGEEWTDRRGIGRQERERERERLKRMKRLAVVGGSCWVESKWETVEGE